MVLHLAELDAHQREPFGIGVRQRLQQHVVQHGQHRGGWSDADREDRDDGHGESPLEPEPACGLAKVRAKVKCHTTSRLETGRAPAPDDGEEKRLGPEPERVESTSCRHAIGVGLRQVADDRIALVFRDQARHQRDGGARRIGHRSGGHLFLVERHTVPQAVERPLGLPQDLAAGGGHFEIPARAAAAPRFRIAQARADQTLGFEPAQREIDRGAEDRAARVSAEFLDDRDAIGVGAEADQREQDEVFEATQRVLSHVDFIYRHYEMRKPRFQ